MRAFHKSEKGRKCHWQIKRAKVNFKINPYNVGKTLLDPKTCATLRFDQHVLDAHKSSSLQDKFYDISLGELEALPHLPLKKIFSKYAFSYGDFLTILPKCRNASAVGINSIKHTKNAQIKQVSP